MGLCAQRIDDMPRIERSDEQFNRDTGFVWIVMRRQERPGFPDDWHIQGICDYEELAIEICADESYFIGPLPCNTALPHDLIDWVGAYYPLRKENLQGE